jgi:hypothetical protein
VRLSRALLFLSMVVCGGGLASAANAAPRFPQCPHVGADTGCGYLITVSKVGSSIATDASQPSYANSNAGTHESSSPTDALIGVQNNLSTPLASVKLTGTSIFEFDGDGICANASGPVPAGCQTPSGSTACGAVSGRCSFPPPLGEPANWMDFRPVGMPAFANGDVQNGYEGPTSWFSNVAPSTNTGMVNLSPAVQPRGSTYFSLEAPPLGLPITTYVVVAKQSAGGVSRRVLYVPSGVRVQSWAHATGGNGHLTGKVTFQLFHSKTCSGRFVTAGTSTVPAGSLVSRPVLLRGSGTYAWQVIYSGDGSNGASVTNCGDQVVVVPRFARLGLPSNAGCVAQLTAKLRSGSQAARAAEVFVNGKLVARFRGSKIRVRLRGRETVAVVASSVGNAFGRGPSSKGWFLQQVRTYRGCQKR